MKYRVLLSVILSLIAFSGFSQTTIADNSNVSGSWTLANSPYVIEGRAIVANGQTLTIEPGVEVRLKSSASPTVSWFDYSAGNVGVIRIQGEIIANGTTADPIVFTRNNTGYWGTILIDESADPNSSFTNCIVEYAKESRNVTGITSTVTFYAGVSIYKNTIHFENNVLRNNRNTGLYIREVDTLFEFSNNTFFDNGSEAITISESTANGINNTIYDNSYSATGYVSAIRCSESDVYLVGNLIYNNDDFGIFTTGSGNTHIVNNTIFGNYQGIRVEDGANTFITNTIVQNNSYNFATTGTIGGATIEMQYSLTDDSSFPANVTDVAGNILNADAAFTSSGAADFSLQSSSACIDNGRTDTTGLNIPALDVSGNNRIDNNIIDIGAVEFQQSISIPDLERLKSLQIGPNPTNAQVEITMNGFISVELYDVYGEFILSSSENIIDLSNQPNGVYILKINSINGLESTKKVIKN